MSWILNPTEYPTYFWNYVTFCGGQFVAIVRKFEMNVSTYYIMTSPTGVNWTRRSLPFFEGEWDAVTYGAGLFVAISGAAVGGIGS